MIEVKNLVKKYGDHLAVDHLNFQIEPGRIYGLLDPNGAGKSTTMNIMTGYLGATEGEVLINGHDILKEPGRGKKMYRVSAGDPSPLSGYESVGISGICGGSERNSGRKERSRDSESHGDDETDGGIGASD